MEIGKCHKCGSGEIEVLNPGKPVLNYQCQKCGHRGSFLITEGWNPRGGKG